MLGITTIMPVFLRRPDSVAISGLLRAIDSVLSQDCGRLPSELLIVDDGSEPPVAELPELRQLLSAHPSVRLIRLRRNRGLSYALNAGLTQARYDLIARLDADDCWRPGKLARQLAMFAADPDLTLVASSMRLVHPGHPELDRDELRGGDWAHVLALTNRIGCPFPHGSILAWRGVFERLGGYPQDAKFEHAEDFALWAQWIRFFKVSICAEVFLDYTVSDSQVSSRFAGQQSRAAAGAARPLDILDDRTRIPKAVESVAGSLGLDLISTSTVLFTAWRFYTHILADPYPYDAVSMLLPDRAVHRCEDLHTLLADRFFYFTKTPFDPDRFPTVRCIHVPANVLRPWVEGID